MLFQGIAVLILGPAFGQEAGSVSTIEDSQAEGEPSDPEVVHELIPFEVDEKRGTEGTYAGRDLATDRIGSSYREMAGSVTSVSAAQMEDTGSVNMHDVFQYEANTEGIYQLTHYTVGPYGNVRDDSQVHLTNLTVTEGAATAQRSLRCSFRSNSVFFLHCDDN